MQKRMRTSVNRIRRDAEIAASFALPRVSPHRFVVRIPKSRGAPRRVVSSRLSFAPPFSRLRDTATFSASLTASLSLALSCSLCFSLLALSLSLTLSLSLSLFVSFTFNELRTRCRFGASHFFSLHAPVVVTPISRISNGNDDGDDDDNER